MKVTLSAAALATGPAPMIRSAGVSGRYYIYIYGYRYTWVHRGSVYINRLYKFDVLGGCRHMCTSAAASNRAAPPCRIPLPKPSLQAHTAALPPSCSPSCVRQPAAQPKVWSLAP